MNFGLSESFSFQIEEGSSYSDTINCLDVEGDSVITIGQPTGASGIITTGTSTHNIGTNLFEDYMYTDIVGWEGGIVKDPVMYGTPPLSVIISLLNL